MRALRAAFGVSLVLGVFAVLGILAWVTHRPDDPRLTAARDWPVVGGAAAWLQDVYLPPPVPAAPAMSGAPSSTETSAASSNEMRSAAAYELEDPGRYDARPDVWVSPEMPLFGAPAADAEVVLTFDRYANLPLLEERDGWRHVRWRDHRGWLAPVPDDGPILGNDPEPPGPLPARTPDAERLAAARALLGLGTSVRKLGPYTLYTDSRNQMLLDRLARLATQLDDIYASRFGRRAIGEPAEAVILFEHQADYRTFQHQSASLAGLNAAGHAGWGMAALYRGDQDLDDVTAVFIHELTHLINRRAIGPGLPLWLNEGLAEALSSSRILPWGGIDPEAWGGHRRKAGPRTLFSGEWVARKNLQHALAEDALPALDNVIGLDDDSFQHRSPRPGLHYTLAGSFLRYLLDGDEQKHRAAFRGFLADVASGGAPSGEALRTLLDTSWDMLDTGYRAWLVEQGDEDHE